MAFTKKSSGKSSSSNGKSKGGASEWKSASAKFRKQWEEARTKAPRSEDGTNLDTGKYIGKITGFSFGVMDRDDFKEVNGKRVKTGKKIKVPWVSIPLVVTRGDEEGEQAVVRLNPASDYGAELMSGTLQILGYDVSEMDLDDVPDLKKMIEKDFVKTEQEVEFRVRRGEFVNINISGVVEDDDEEEDEDEEGDEDEEEEEEGDEEEGDEDEEEDSEEEEEEDEDAEEEDEEEDDEEEEEEAPRRRSTKKKPAKKPAKKPVKKKKKASRR